MKLFSFATIVAVAGIGHVLAVPLLVVPPSDISSVNLRLGQAVGDKTESVPKMRKKGPCRAHRFSQKAVEVSNLFREAFGLPLIKTSGHPGFDDGRVKILPFIGTPNTFAPVHGKDAEGFNVISVSTLHDRPPHHGHHRHAHAHGRHRHHGGHHHLGKGSFINRIHYSIMNLGRWEGRAVAFVLGCGIGVLLRMFFVLAVVIYRAVKGQRGEEQHEYSQITIIEEFVDSSKSSPPVYVDEKFPIEEVVDNSKSSPKSSPPSYVDENYPVVESVKAPSSSEESK